jgi:hypothetical protein
MHTKSLSPVFSTQLFADKNSPHIATINYLKKKDTKKTNAYTRSFATSKNESWDCFQLSKALELSV